MPAKRTSYHSAYSAEPALQASATSELDACDLAEFGAGGPRGSISGRLRSNEMAQAVKQALQTESHAVIEAPTGTGKSIAYLAPAEQTVVIATASRSCNIETLHQGHPLFAPGGPGRLRVVVKGRSNYICTLKWEKELLEQRTFSLYDREGRAGGAFASWLDEADTGDVDDLPAFVFVAGPAPLWPGQLPRRLPASRLPFYHDDCWVNRMRDRRRPS